MNEAPLVAAAGNSSCLVGHKEIQIGHRIFLCVRKIHHTGKEMEEKLSLGGSAAL